MLPEQIWDEPDFDGLVFGGPAGSAMPLVWAHSEYLKLLRSAHDGRVFDCIPIVEERYAQGNHPESRIEVFKVLRRQIREMTAGISLRITSASRFQVIWTSDDWKTSHVLRQHSARLCGIVCRSANQRSDRRGRLSFTLFWPEENRWEGRNFDVVLESPS